MMLLRCSKPLFLSVVVLSFVFCAQPARTQNQSADQVEITHYALSIDNITRMLQATQAMQQAGKADPSLKMKDSDDSPQTLDAISSRIASIPKAVAILSSFNLTPRSYAVTLMSMLQTGFAQAAIDSGAKEADIVSSGAASASNLAFLRAHKAEIEALTAKYPMQS